MNDSVRLYTRFYTRTSTMIKVIVYNWCTWVSSNSIEQWSCQDIELVADV